MKNRVMMLGILAIIGIAMSFGYTALTGAANEPEVLNPPIRRGNWHGQGSGWSRC